MTVRGKVKNGKVVLDDPKAIPDGTAVEVRPVKGKPPKAKPAQSTKKKKGSAPRSFMDRFRDFIGSVKDLPPDMSINLDHYLYGHPKKT